jgi:hypothetical protein
LGRFPTLTLYGALAATLFRIRAVVYSFRSVYEELGRKPLIHHATFVWPSCPEWAALDVVFVSGSSAIAQGLPNSAKNSATRGCSRGWQNGPVHHVGDTLVCQKRQERNASAFSLRRVNAAKSPEMLPASFLPASAATVRRAILGPFCLSTPSFDGDRFTLAPST